MAHDYPPLEEVWMEPDVILDRVWVHLNELTVNPDTMLYFYCALELRFFIEALYFRVLLSAREGRPTRRDMKAYRPGEFLTLLADADPDWLTSATKSAGADLAPEDVRIVNEWYGKLDLGCTYLASRSSSRIETQWLLEFEQVMSEASDYLHRRLVGYTYPGEHLSGSES